ncbi:MAG: DsbA family protein [Janthinobacterium lividum]
MALAKNLPAQAPAATTQAAPADPFPPTNPKFFDAASPTTADVDGFLKAIWGYDANRSWRVAAIQKTQAPGVSKVTIFLADKSQGNKVESVRFFVTPDGKFAIADTVFAFGLRPFDATAKVLAEQAKGPAEGSTSKGLLLVEFSDLQCPHCKEAAPVMDNLKRDFPDARIVYQNYPLTEIHPFAYKAAAYNDCVAAAKGDAAAFAYMHEVFEHQESLTPELAQQTLDNAVTRAGALPASIATCSTTPATKAKVDAEMKLAEQVGVDQTPMLAVNGHLIPLGGVSYETLKQIVEWDRKQTAR